MSVKFTLVEILTSGMMVPGNVGREPEQHGTSGTGEY
jgi:hypothetical protein